MILRAASRGQDLPSPGYESYDVRLTGLRSSGASRWPGHVIGGCLPGLAESSPVSASLVSNPSACCPARPQRSGQDGELRWLRPGTVQHEARGADQTITGAIDAHIATEQGRDDGTPMAR
jgi:hypothetical protein